MAYDPKWKENLKASILWDCQSSGAVHELSNSSYERKKKAFFKMREKLIKEREKLKTQLFRHNSEIIAIKLKRLNEQISTMDFNAALTELSQSQSKTQEPPATVPNTKLLSRKYSKIIYDKIQKTQGDPKGLDEISKEIYALEKKHRSPNILFEPQLSSKRGRKRFKLSYCLTIYNALCKAQNSKHSLEDIYQFLRDNEGELKRWMQDNKIDFLWSSFPVLTQKSQLLQSFKQRLARRIASAGNTGTMRKINNSGKQKINTLLESLPQNIVATVRRRIKENSQNKKPNRG